MPEGDAIVRTARTLQRALGGHVVERFESVLAPLTRVDDDTPIAGRTVERVRAAGKHLLIELSGGLVLRTHMRMTGSWHLYRRGERWRRPRRDMRLVLATASFEAVAFNVPVAEFTRAAQTRGAARVLPFGRPDPVASLGPDVPAPDFDAASAIARMREAARGRTIGEVLLDQRVIAGIGNVYKSEVCFLCGVHPFTPAAALDDRQLEALISKARALMTANVHEAAAGRIITRRTLRSAVGRGDPDGERLVYGRAGRPCHRCGTPIERAVRGEYERTTYWCPSCQPAAE
ncbi:MAG TPA: DNA-formamidopyrimidine glycosylase family protein [Vicinamibacterales bacterium]|nr:DNA-formamidopyrimidine glycosylase family protein [Vicinamibacterales bacterium]